IRDELDVNVDERRYDSETMMKALEEARDYIDAHVLGKNESFMNVTKPIVLIEKIPETSIKIKWKLDDKNIIDSKGNLKNDNIPKEGELVQITAQIQYYDTVEYYPITLMVKPKVISKEEKIIKELTEAIESKSKDSLTSKKQILP